MTDAEIKAQAHQVWQTFMNAVHRGEGYTAAFHVLHAALRKVAGRVTVERKQCVGCQSPFQPMRKDALYCSDACRQRAYRVRRRSDGEPFKEER